MQHVVTSPIPAPLHHTTLLAVRFLLGGRTMMISGHTQVWPRITLCALAVYCVGMGEVRGDDALSVGIGGSLLDGKNTELNIIHGGETIRLALTGGGADPMRYKQGLLESEDLFQAFLEDLCRTHTGEDSGFVRNINKLILRSATRLRDDGRVLEITLQPLEHFQIVEEEVIYLHIPSVALDCECSYRIPVLKPIVLIPMEAPTPVLTAPSIMCTPSVNLTALPVSLPHPAVAAAYTVSWHIEAEDNPGASVSSPTSATTTVQGLHHAGNTTVTVVFRLRDDEKNASVVIERVESPAPAEVGSPIMHVAGSTAMLNAMQVVGGGSDARGEWSLDTNAPNVELKDPTDPATEVSGLDGKTVFTWRVAGHHRCPATSQRVEVTAQHPRVSPWEDSVCGNELPLSAEPPALQHLRGSWSLVEGEGVRFLPSPSLPSVKAIGFGYGQTSLLWTLVGDGGSSSSVNVTFSRRREPQAEIITQQPEAFLGSEQVVLEAQVPTEGSGEWSIVRTSCDPPPAVAEGAEGSPVTRIVGLDKVAKACEMSIEWTVSNPPCPSSTTSLTVAVTARPPTRPEVGPPIKLCQDVPVELTGNTVEVGVGRWEAVTPADLDIPDASNPRARLPRVRRGETVVRWVVANGGESQHADLAITRHALPLAVVLTPSTPSTEFCGPSVHLEAQKREFGPEDYGRWEVDGPAECLACGASACGDCRQSASVNFTALRPGESKATWSTYNRQSLADCPGGNSVNVTLKSWQFPKQEFVMYVVGEAAPLDIRSVLKDACTDDVFYPRYIDELSQLPGVWGIHESHRETGIIISRPKDDIAEVGQLPMGASLVTWTPLRCEGSGVSLILKIVRGERLGCSISSSGKPVGARLDVVGDVIDLAIDSGAVSLTTYGEWSADREGASFSNSTAHATTASNLTEGETVFTFRITAGIDAFAGECSVSISSWRAQALPPGHAVCSRSANVEAVPPAANAPKNLVARWVTPEGSPVHIVQPTSHQTAVSNLQPGENLLWWRLELNGDIDEVPVVATRHDLPIPFNSSSLMLRKKLVNTGKLVLPWENRPEWPVSEAEWQVSSGHTLTYRAGAIEFSGIRAAHKGVFSFVIKPIDSACAPMVFTIEVEVVDAGIVGTPITSECTLLHGTSMTLNATRGLEWRRDLQEGDFASLRRSLGPVLDEAFLEGEVGPVNADLLHLRFSPAYLPGGEVTAPLVVRNVPVPVDLLASHIITASDTYIMFEGEMGPSEAFTVWPVELHLSFNGRHQVDEHVLNTEGGSLAVSYYHANMSEIAVSLGRPESRAALISSIASRNNGQPFGWDMRREKLLSGNASFVEGHDVVQLEVLPDPWYTIGQEEEIHIRARLATVCGLGDRPQSPKEREVRSAFLRVADTPPQLTVKGVINECDFEQKGALIEVSAVGCSFLEEARLVPQYFHSSKPHLPRGWGVMVAKGMLNASSQGSDPKRRVLRVEPVGPRAYEIPQDEEEELTLMFPSDLMANSGEASGYLVEASGSVVVKDTSLEVRGTVICADRLRYEGHNLTMILHGDAWNADIATPGGAAALIGAISGDQRITGGWETVLMTRVLPEKLYTVTLLSSTELLITFPPLPWYTSQRAESIGIQIPGPTTVCSKCLEQDHLMHIYHAHNLVAKVPQLQRPLDNELEVMLPCARFAVGLSPQDVKSGIASVLNVSYGFNENRGSVVGNAWWTSNQTLMVPFNWRAAVNDTVDENITLTLPANSVVPSTGQAVTLVHPVALRAVPLSSRDGFISTALRHASFWSPVLQYLTFHDFVRAPRVRRAVDRRLFNEASDVVVYLLGMEIALAFLSILAGRSSWLILQWAVESVYITVGAFGMLVFQYLTIITDFTKLRKRVAFFDAYIYFCYLLAVFILILTVNPFSLAGDAQQTALAASS